MKLTNFFILETTTNTKQPLRWKFNQSHKHLPVLSPDFSCLKKMCSMANLFERNIRKFDAKKCIFLPKMLKAPLPLPFNKGGGGVITIFILTNPFQHYLSF